MNTTYDSLRLDTILNSLANQKRRGILHELSLNPATVGQLAQHHDLSLPAIHRHIRSLENAELIIRKKSGRTNFVALNQKTLHQVQAWITQYQTGWGSPDASLENYISRMNE
ncbi:MAG: transcriptional regulator [Candidatus Saccharibacteria bacterium]|nr:transcriptional regulator [Candidatus Saccharibacteria bacterium]